MIALFVVLLALALLYLLVVLARMAKNDQSTISSIEDKDFSGSTKTEEPTYSETKSKTVKRSTKQ